MQPDAFPARADRASTPVTKDGGSSQVSDVSWDAGVITSTDADFVSGVDEAHARDIFRAAPVPEDADSGGIDGGRIAPGVDEYGSAVSRPDDTIATRGEDGNPRGVFSLADDFPAIASRRGEVVARPPGAASRIAPVTRDPVSIGVPRSAPDIDSPMAGDSTAGAGVGATGGHSRLYGEPVCLEGRSLEGAVPSCAPPELARPLERAEMPVEDLESFEPDPAGTARGSNPGRSDGRHPGDVYRDLQDRVARFRRGPVPDEMGRLGRDARMAGSASIASSRSGATSARGPESVAAVHATLASFSDGPRRRPSAGEYGAVYVERTGRSLAPCHGADPPSTVDGAHAARYTPRPEGSEPGHESGFGRPSPGWNPYPFTRRERVLNALASREALIPEQIAVLESGLQGCRAVGDDLASTQYRAMVDMISDLGDRYRHTRWSAQGEDGARLLQLIELLDHAAGAA